MNIAEETERPSRNYPRILFGGLAIAGLLYTAVLLVSSTGHPNRELASRAPRSSSSARPAARRRPKVFSAITLFALANGALINMIMASRLVYGMSEEGIAPGFFGRVLPGRKTPITAIAFTTLLGLILVSTGDLASLADTTVMLLLIAFTAVNISVLVLRRDPVDHDHFTAPVFAPLVGIAASIYLIAENEAEVFVRAGLLLLLGLAFWLVAYAGGHRPGKGKTERATGAP